MRANMYRRITRFKGAGLWLCPSAPTGIWRPAAFPSLNGCFKLAIYWLINPRTIARLRLAAAFILRGPAGAVGRREDRPVGVSDCGVAPQLQRSADIRLLRFLWLLGSAPGGLAADVLLARNRLPAHAPRSAAAARCAQKSRIRYRRRQRSQADRGRTSQG